MSQITEIYNRQVDTVYRICYSFMKNSTEAEDMVQETFLRLICAGKQFENERHEKAWLIVTASNLCKDELKRFWRRNDSLEDHPKMEAKPQRQVLTAILELPKDYKAVVYMYYYEGYSTAEIAEYLGCSHGTVRSRLSRARSKLKDILGGAENEET